MYVQNFGSESLKPKARDFLLEKGYELVELPGSDEETLKKAIATVDAVIARTEKYTPAVINTPKNLKIIALAASGMTISTCRPVMPRALQSLWPGAAIPIQWQNMPLRWHLPACVRFPS